MRSSHGFTLFEMVIALAALSILGAVAATTTVGVIRDANVEATAQGVELLAHWRSQVATFNRSGTTTCWNQADLAVDCTGDGTPETVPVPGVLNEGKAMFWPVIKAPWVYVCDPGRYPDHFRRVSMVVGRCEPGWSYPLGSDMGVFVRDFPEMRIPQ
ncbi:pilus assembly FimT family protein [Gloeobacter violaceus]|nr:type II secretion system protein [Gloeobacter violaceus]